MMKFGDFLDAEFARLLHKAMKALGEFGAAAKMQDEELGSAAAVTMKRCMVASGMLGSTVKEVDSLDEIICEESTSAAIWEEACDRAPDGSMKARFSLTTEEADELTEEHVVNTKIPKGVN